MINNCFTSDNTCVQCFISHSIMTSGFFGKNINAYTTNTYFEYTQEQIAQATVVKELMDMRDGVANLPFMSPSEIDCLLTYACTLIFFIALYYIKLSIWLTNK